jgi:hypothetical protein
MRTGNSNNVEDEKWACMEEEMLLLNEYILVVGPIRNELLQCL